jgi:hypothetical protein
VQPVIPAFRRLRQEDCKFQSQPELHSMTLSQKSKKKKIKTLKIDKALSSKVSSSST